MKILKISSRSHHNFQSLYFCKVKKWSPISNQINSEPFFISKWIIFGWWTTMGECYLEIKGRKCRIRFHFLFFFQNVRFLSDFGEEWIIMKRNYLVCIIVFAFFLSCRQVFLLLRLKGTLIAKIYGFKSIGIPIFRLNFQ